MHIPDNYLSPASCAVLAVAAAPVIVLSVKKVKVQLKENKEAAIPSIGASSLFSFNCTLTFLTDKTITGAAATAKTAQLAGLR